MLHERHDDEPAAVGEGADLERHPGHCAEPAGDDHVADAYDERRARGPGPWRALSTSEEHFDQAAGDEHDREIGAHRGGCGTACQAVEDPTGLLGSSPPYAGPAGWDQRGRRVHRHGGDRRSGASCCCEHRLGRVTSQKKGGQGKDHNEPRDDEANSAEHGCETAAEPPGAIDGELSGCRTGEQVGGGHAVFELTSRDPTSLVHAEPSQQGDVGRRATEADAAEASPLAGDGGELHALRRRPWRGLGSTHRSAPRISRASSRSCLLASLSSRRPLAVAV